MRHILVCLIMFLGCNVFAMHPGEQEESSGEVIDVRVVDIQAPTSESLNNVTLRALPNISTSGMAWINKSLPPIFETFTEEQRGCVISSAINGGAIAGARFVNFWKFVSYVGDPLGNLARVAVIVLPILSSGLSGNMWSSYSEDTERKDKEFTSAMNIATAIAGVVSLSFEKICGYANDKIANQEKMALCLRTLRDSNVAEGSGADSGV